MRNEVELDVAGVAAQRRSPRRAPRRQPVPQPSADRHRSTSFGDGTIIETADRAAHTYLHAGDRTVTLTLTWTADYAIGTGQLAPIDDTTTTTSAPRILPVREAQTVIVDEG